MPKTRWLPGTIRGSGPAQALLSTIVLGALLVAPWASAQASLGVGRATSRSLAASTTAAARRRVGPRDDMQTALAAAREQFNALELDAALVTLEAGVVRAQGAGMGADAALAPLLVLRGGIVYSTTGDQARTLQAFEEAVAANYHAVLPIELRSAELQALLDKARQGATVPAAAVIHTPPTFVAGQDLVIEAVAGVSMPDGAQLTLYYRPKGATGEFTAVYMTLYGSFGTATITAGEHGDAGLEYFFYVYDAQTKPLGSRGNQEAPLVLEPSAASAAVADPGATGGDGDGDGGGEVTPSKPRKKRGKSSLPRVFIGLGLGTGVGLAKGRAEQTYEQYTPGVRSASYGRREQACAVERWFRADRPLAANALAFQQDLDQILAQGNDILPAPAQELAMAYDSGYCSKRHPVTTGLASAPLHLAPEVGIRIGRAFVVSVFGRLQIVTGSKVFTVDPTGDIRPSFDQDVRSSSPAGVQTKPPFTFAVGLKGKYFFGRDDAKLRLFAGGFAGYGQVRLRVKMNFANDRNGNSVPDRGETALFGQTDAAGAVIPSTCIEVWPYNEGCAETTGAADRTLAEIVRTTTDSDDERIDTVVLGPAFAGLLFGAHYQIVKNVALFAEVNIGGWFPNAGSVVLDINVGPVLTF